MKRNQEGDLVRPPGWIHPSSPTSNLDTMNEQYEREASLSPPPAKKISTVNPDTDPCPRCKKQATCYVTALFPICAVASNVESRVTLLLDVNQMWQTHPRVVTITKEIKMLQSYNDIYKKTAKVDGIFVKCYVYCYVMCCDVLCYVRYRHWKPS